MKRFQPVLILFTILFFHVENGMAQGLADNKIVARRYFEEVVNNQRLDLLDKIYADHFLVHGLIDSTETHKTLKDQKEFLSYLFKAFPDIHYTIGDVIGEGDKVFIRVTLHATHKNEFWGYQGSGNRIKYLSEIFVFKFEKGRIKESWVQLDLYNLFKFLSGQNK